MRKCVYCGHLYRGTPRRCPDCDEVLPTLTTHLASLSRVQLAISLSGLNWSEADQLELKAFPYLNQEMTLADVAAAIAARDNGRYTRFCIILKNLSVA